MVCTICCVHTILRDKGRQFKMGLAGRLREDFRRLQRGVRQKNLNLSMVREIRIPAPTLALQQTFATRIQAIEALKATHRAALAELDALFASLQQRAFAGAL